MGKKYYAVAVGKIPGIYNLWSEAEPLVKGFRGAKYKSFQELSEANEYIAKITGTGKYNRTSDNYNDNNNNDSTCTSSNKTIWKKSSLENSTVSVTKRKYSNSSFESNEETRKKSKFEKSDGNEVYYAVAKGIIPGIYNTWKECEKQVKKRGSDEFLYSAKFKKFATLEEAQLYMEEFKNNKVEPNTDEDYKNPNNLVAFTDGSSLNNGKKNCKAGYAVVFPHNESWNECRPIINEKKTNNTAEYRAALLAVNRANKENSDQSKPLWIFSDSMLLIRSMTEWVTGWKKKNWIKSDGKQVENKALLQMLLTKIGSRRVFWKHVKAHTNKRDWKSIYNDKVDKLAKEGAFMS